MRRTAKRKTHGRQSKSPVCVNYQPKTIKDVLNAMRDAQNFPSPVRAVGSGSATTRCNHSKRGTLLDMTAMKDVIRMTDTTVTVGAGMSLRSLADHLAHEGMELTSGYEYPERTVGGLISSGSLAAGVPGDAGHLAATVKGITMVSAQGRQVTIFGLDLDMQ